MTESTLAASIFGGGDDAKDSSLTSIFDSSHLPATPNNQNFTEPAAKKEKRERKEEKKRKRKDKKKTASESEASGEGKNDTSETKKNEEEETPVNEDEERTIFVGNLPNNATRKYLTSLFKSCGKVKSARIRSVLTAGVKVAPEHAGNQVSYFYYHIPFRPKFHCMGIHPDWLTICHLILYRNLLRKYRSIQRS